MSEIHNKLARILRTEPQVLLNMEEKMEKLTGKSDVLENILNENYSKINKRLSELGLKKESSYNQIYQALSSHIITLENKLWSSLGGSDSKLIVSRALALENPEAGFFIKKEKAIDMLCQNPPPNILKHFGYVSVDELVEKEGLESVYSALRFIESNDWMNNVFINSYNELTVDDFEEREVKLIVLDEKWFVAAEKFLEKKYHNVSHLKELGVIFVIPLKIDSQGELLRVFTLLLHYLNEVPYYSSLFKRFSRDDNFSEKLQSLLRGDVSDQKVDSQTPVWRIIQRYLAKDDPSDFRLGQLHVNPEAEHWYKAQVSLSKVPGFEDIINYDFVGDFWDNELISFDLIDLIISLVKKDKKYLYHQQEALWNKIFIEYIGRDKMNQLIEENIVKGFIEL